MLSSANMSADPEFVSFSKASNETLLTDFDAAFSKRFDSISDQSR